MNNLFKKLFFAPKSVYYHNKKHKFIQKFNSFDKTSSFGLIGFGDTCVIKGHSKITVGANTWVGFDSQVIALEKHFSQILDPCIIIGNNVRVTSKLRITCAKKILIDDNVLIAPEVFITDHNHGMNPLEKKGYSPQEITFSEVHICEGVWLGQRVTVLPGVTIGEHSIVGANSVVTKNIPSNSIAVGNPAKVVKKWNFETNVWEKVD